ncbi:hypothetical protein HD806DRAFT_526514 [Xylariaceae sp. AK1471]|nr:hypothetical protein HD806DRAFT_526514 [Xylariaceae sp. AK1471]
MTGGSYLPALQDMNLANHDGLKPLVEDIDPASFDLVAPAEELDPQYSIEARSELLFSVDHLKVIFDDPKPLQEFTSFLYTLRPESVPLLIHYLNSVKALKTIGYANAIIRELTTINSIPSSKLPIAETTNKSLVVRANEAFEMLAREELPAYVTHVWTRFVSITIKQRITNTLPLDLRDLSEDLAKVFCLTDPSRHDNPIIFASEEFHRASQYGRRFALGRNCRFLQGPKTDHHSVQRLRQMLTAGKEHCETLLNYRRDGSVFMNLLTVVPLYDNRGNIRYHLGTQVDVSGLVRECDGLKSLRDLVVQRMHQSKASASNEHEDIKEPRPSKDTLGDLAEMFTLDELKMVQASGGTVHGTHYDELNSVGNSPSMHNTRRLFSKDKALPMEAPTNNSSSSLSFPLSSSSLTSRFRGILEHYLLVRPFPNLRILFASPSLRVPGMLQSSFLSRIGGSHSDRDTISQAFKEGKSVTAKIRWLARPIPGLEVNANPSFAQGRSRWIQTTPLFGVNGAVGVWMVVLVNDEEEKPRVLDAPPIELYITERKRPFDGGVDGNISANDLDTASLNRFTAHAGDEERLGVPDSVALGVSKLGVAEVGVDHSPNHDQEGDTG